MIKKKITAGENITKQKKATVWIRYKHLIIPGTLLIIHIFFRFYQIEDRLTFGWDQLDNAFASKFILIDHDYPLVGMESKANSGFGIGAFYYYLIAPFYALFSFNPIASGYFAGVVSVLTVIVLYVVSKKLFSYPVAVIVMFLNTFAFFVIDMERIQWPVNFIPLVSYLVFYFLYKAITTYHTKYLLYLAFVVGFSFHIHFTSVFYPLLIFLTLPLFRWDKKTLLYGLLGIGIVVLWMIPHIFLELQKQTGQTKNLSVYLATYYHGIHVRRILQVAKDAFIEFPFVLRNQLVDQVLKYLFLPFFVLLLLKKEKSRNTLLLCYVSVLWFLVPWFIFSTYKGEISNYYFVSTRPIVLMILAYLMYLLWVQRVLLAKLLVAGYLLYFACINTQLFFEQSRSKYLTERERVEKKLAEGTEKQHFNGPFDSYMYWYLTKDKRSN